MSFPSQGQAAAGGLPSWSRGSVSTKTGAEAKDKHANCIRRKKRNDTKMAKEMCENDGHVRV